MTTIKPGTCYRCGSESVQYACYAVQGKVICGECYGEIQAMIESYLGGAVYSNGERRQIAIPDKNLQTLTIPLLPQLNDYVRLCRGNFRIANRAKQAADDTVMWCARAQQIKPLKAKAHLIITYFDRDSRIDFDNRAHSKKYILDGLVKAGALKDDGRKYLLSPKPWVEEFRIDRKNPRIEIGIVDTEVPS